MAQQKKKKKKRSKITTECRCEVCVCVFQTKRAVLHKTHYVELMLVVDNDRVSQTEYLFVLS